MKILVVNPNSSEIVTEVIIRSAKRKIVNPNTEIIPLTNYRGTKNIDCAFGDYQSTWSLIRAILKKVEEIKPDAVVLARAITVSTKVTQSNSRRFITSFSVSFLSNVPAT